MSDGDVVEDLLLEDGERELAVLAEELGLPRGLVLRDAVGVFRWYLKAQFLLGLSNPALHPPEEREHLPLPPAPLLHLSRVVGTAPIERWARAEAKAAASR